MKIPPCPSSIYTATLSAAIRELRAKQADDPTPHRQALIDAMTAELSALF